MNKYVNIFIGAFLAGLAIGVGGTAYLSVENKVAGAVLFTVGLYTIVVQGLNLFTGKVGYIPYNKASYFKDLAVIWLGNLAGTAAAACAVLCTRVNGISSAAAAMCEVKGQDSLISLFILAVFCGMLMFIAVEGYKRVQNPLILIFCVAGFILCGFEHCIADMFYFTLAGAWNLNMLGRLIVITIGNGAGGVLIPLYHKLQEKDALGSNS